MPRGHKRSPHDEIDHTRGSRQMPWPLLWLHLLQSSERKCKLVHHKIGVKMNRLLHTLCCCCCCCCGWLLLLLLINMELCEGRQTHTASTYVDSSSSSSFPPVLLLCLLELVAAWFDVCVRVCIDYIAHNRAIRPCHPSNSMPLTLILQGRINDTCCETL